MLKNIFQTRFQRPASYYSALDGLRAIAILMVMIFHAALPFVGLYEVHDKSQIVLLAAFAGSTGVDLFFVLSGFLIGSQIIAEMTRTGSFSFKRFFIKRTLRIFPAYYFSIVITLVIFLVLYGKDLAKYHEAILYHIFYLQNYFPPIMQVSYWSLAVEEQFYVLLPLLLFVFRKVLIAHPRAMLAVLVGLCVLPILTRTSVYLDTLPHTKHHFSTIMNLHYPFHTRFDQLLMGVLVGFIFQRYRETLISLRGFYTGLTVFIVANFISLLFNANSPTQVYQPYVWIFQYTFIGLEYSAIVLWLLLFPGRISKFLSSQFLFYIATLSYTLYLYNYLVVGLSVDYIMNNLPPNTIQTISSSAWGIVGFIVLCSVHTIVVAHVFYKYIECPFLYLKDRLYAHAPLR